jgi:NitT/TauT family transport system ATP-binding protein
MLMHVTEHAPLAHMSTSPVGTVLFANRVDKTYPNGTHALNDVRLGIRRGEFISLLGPSGCGKSTLLRMFAGLESPTAGEIRWWNHPSIPRHETERGMSMVFQEATLMPWADVETNVRLPLDLVGLPRVESTPRVAEALVRVGLDRFHRSYPRELSGGMQMRASIARALATEPNLLLMDEPFGALDEFTRNKLDADMRALWLRQDLTVVFVTHSIYEAVFLSTKVVVMGARPGRIIAEVDIEGSTERDEAYRMSPVFMQQCQHLSELLTQASHATEHSDH